MYSVHDLLGYNAGMEMPRRRWSRFSLRTLFILLTVFAVWLGIQAKWIQDRRDARKWIADHTPAPGPTPTYAWFGDEVKRLPWTLQMLGEQPLEYIAVEVGPDDSEQVESLRALFPEATIQTLSSGRSNYPPASAPTTSQVGQVPCP